MTYTYKHTFLIVYPTGTYGSFIDWCINWFSGQIDQNILPFTANGSAHLWRGNAAGDVNGQAHKTIEWFLTNDLEPFTIRTHLIFEEYKHANFEKLLHVYQQNFRKVILINNHPDCHLLTLHNTYTKSKAHTYNQLKSYIIHRYSSQFNAQEPIPTWQLREMMSYWHGSYHCQLRDTYQPLHGHNLINVDVRDLVYNFEQCLCSLFDQLSLPMSRKSQLPEIKNTWLALQKFKNLDQKIERVIEATVSNEDLEFGVLDHILDEAFVQWKLRSCRSTDLMCFGLDQFPTNTKTLRDLLIPYVDQG